MNQTRRESATETAVNVGLGMAVSQGLTMLIFGTGAAESFGIVVIYTTASAARGYLVRRFFNSRKARVRNNKTR